MNWYFGKRARSSHVTVKKEEERVRAYDARGRALNAVQIDDWVLDIEIKEYPQVYAAMIERLRGLYDIFQQLNMAGDDDRSLEVAQDLC